MAHKTCITGFFDSDHIRDMRETSYAVFKNFLSRLNFPEMKIQYTYSKGNYFSVAGWLSEFTLSSMGNQHTTRLLSLLDFLLSFFNKLSCSTVRNFHKSDPVFACLIVQ